MDIGQDLWDKVNGGPVDLIILIPFNLFPLKPTPHLPFITMWAGLTAPLTACSSMLFYARQGHQQNVWVGDH